MQKTISGFFTEPGHGNPDQQAFRHPAIKFVVRGKSGEKSCVGMIDSGADLCRLDTGISDELGLPTAGVMPSIVTGIKVDIEMRTGTLFFPECNFTLKGSFPIAPFRESGNMYDAILGMDFIQHFDISILSSVGEVRLRYFK